MSEMGIRERVTNVLLLLYLIEKTNDIGQVEDELKLQKLVFLSQKRLVRRKLKAFSYNFFRWKKGPFSKNLRIDLITLLQANFLTMRESGIELTEKARELLNISAELLNENRDFLADIDIVASQYSELSPEEIKAFVYSLRVVVPRIREVMSIRNIPLSQLILFKTSDKKARSIFRIDDSWLATLELTFDIDAIKSLERAVDDAIEGRVQQINL